LLQIILGTPEIATLLDLLDDLRGNSVLEKGYLRWRDLVRREFTLAPPMLRRRVYSRE